jgi:RNA polymerase sigma factor (sigma-70 family)
VRKSALPDDEALIAAFLKGEPAALRTVDRWIDSALRRHLGPSHDSLEDLRQDVNLRLIRNLRRAGFQGMSSLETYVRRIASYASIDFLRRATGRRKILTLDEGGEWLTSGGSVEAAYLALDMARTVLSGLSDRDRLLVWLVFGERYSYAEAARRLGKSVGAVKVRAHRCRRQIRGRFPGE